MGYRSDVAIAMKKADYEKLLHDAKKVEKKHPDKYKGLANLLEYPQELKEYSAADLHATENYVTIYWEWIKWYNDTDPVIDWVEEHLPEYHKLIRIGEEHGDIEINEGEFDECISELITPIEQIQFYGDN